MKQAAAITRAQEAKRRNNRLDWSWFNEFAKNRIALATAFAQYPPMLARVLSAAVSGIEAFPVEVEAASGWGVRRWS